jgi:hypothetical protein
MLRILSIFGLALSIISCDSRLTNIASHQSPNGRKKIIVIEQLMGSNDHAPWWTHISLTAIDDNENKTPGNLIRFEGRGVIQVDWINEADVTIFIDDALFSQFNGSPISMFEGTQVTLRSASSRSKIQSEQAAPRNR